MENNTPRKPVEGETIPAKPFKDHLKEQEKWRAARENAKNSQENGENT